MATNGNGNGNGRDAANIRSLMAAYLANPVTTSVETLAELGRATHYYPFVFDGAIYCVRTNQHTYRPYLDYISMAGLVLDTDAADGCPDGARSFELRSWIDAEHLGGAPKTGIRLKVVHKCPSDEDAINTIRQAVKAWRETPGGKKAFRSTNGDFNWGDVALHEIPWPPEILAVIVIDETEVYFVNHDELLMAG